MPPKQEFAYEDLLGLYWFAFTFNAVSQQIADTAPVVLGTEHF